ncbi:MAG: DUF456 domain-containing protein [Candidatus Omnitrophota bacterium]|nr:MAG: DUF456 domain-containing protein [Candidatus Omnitrophota bacterium]
MEALALAILIIFSLAGLAAIFFTTFGTLIILIGSLLYALLTNFSIISVKTLIILTIFYLCGEVLEYFFIIIGAKKLGASNAAAFGALIGGIFGAILGAVGFFGVGLLAGTFLGIFLGAFLVELFIQRNLVKSLKSGAGGVIGRVGSIIAKVAIAIIMLSIIASSII